MNHDDNPHESDGTHPEACTYCGDVWPCAAGRITELEAEVATLRAVVRYADAEFCEWREGLDETVGRDLDDECAAAVRRATEETP